jgi:RNA recognition motif-containing protein
MSYFIIFAKKITIMVKLFVGGFPLEMNEMEIVQLFSHHAEVKTIKIVRDKVTKVCKGYAFLEVTSQEDADNAMEALDGSFMGDKQLSVRAATEKVEAPRRVNTSSNYKKVERSNDPIKKKRPRRTV